MGDFFKIVYDYVFILQLLAVSFSVVWVFYPLKKTLKSVSIAIVHIIIIFAVGTLLNFLLFWIAQGWRALAGINFPIAWLITIILYLGIFNRMHITSRIIMGATLFTTVIAMADLGSQAGRLLSSSYSGNNFDFVNIIADVLIIAFGFLMKYFSFQYYSDIPKGSVVMILINSVTSVTLILFKIIQNMHTGNLTSSFYCATLVGIYIFSVVGYMMIYFHCKVRKEKTTLEVENKLLESDKQMLKLSEQAIEEMRGFRHDIKNQYKVMDIMLDEQKYDDLKKYFASMTGTFFNESANIHYIDCGNSIINSIINMEILKAFSNGVQLMTKINVPSVLPFELSNLCRILVNLIDNAIEAVVRANKKDAIVDCKIMTVNDYLYLCVRNDIEESVDRSKLLEMNTVKEDAANHGIGHRILKRIVEKYNGCINYTVVENEFIAEVMLDLKSVKEGCQNG